MKQIQAELKRVMNLKEAKEILSAMIALSTPVIQNLNALFKEGDLGAGDKVLIEHEDLRIPFTVFNGQDLTLNLEIHDDSKASGLGAWIAKGDIVHCVLLEYQRLRLPFKVIKWSSDTGFLSLELQTPGRFSDEPSSIPIEQVKRLLESPPSKKK